MQCQIGVIAAQAGKLGDRLLDPVLAEDPLAGLKGGAHAVRRVGLADATRFTASAGRPAARAAASMRARTAARLAAI